MLSRLVVCTMILTTAATVGAAIPPEERDALVALHESTGGASWKQNAGWLDSPGTECNWHGVSCNADETTVIALGLGANRLAGTLPPALGQLSNLQRLDLSRNRLTGAIPDTFSRLEDLTLLWLVDNRLTSIPAGLGDLDLLEELLLSRNHVEGAIPPSLGSLASVRRLALDGNRLTGEIPDSLLGLADRLPDIAIDLRWNGVFTANPALTEFLRRAQVRQSFETTQTVAPSAVQAFALGPDAALIRWRPIEYTLNLGGYMIAASNNPDGPFTLLAQTRDKTALLRIVRGLTAGQTYYFRIRSSTLAHDRNPGTVLSEPSESAVVDAAPTTVGTLSLVFPAFRATEGETKRIPVLRLDGAAGPVSVDYATAADTADPGSDFTPVSGTLSWPAGDGRPRFIELPVLADDLAEGRESLEIRLSNPTGGAVLTPPTTARITIHDNGLTSAGEAAVSSGGQGPAVGVDAVGNRTVAWAHSGPLGGSAILVRRYDSAGSSPAMPTVVSASVAADLSSPAVACSDGGRCVVVWVASTTEKAHAGSPSATQIPGDGVFGRVFDADGEPDGPAFAVGDSVGGNAVSPAVAIEPVSGRFVVAWQEQPTSSGKVLSVGNGVFGRLFRSNGQPEGETFTIDDGSSGDAGNPTVATDDDGLVVVAWERADGDSTLDVIARAFTPDKSLDSGELLINTDTDGDQCQPSLAITPDGSFVVTWQGPSLPGAQGDRAEASDVFGRTFTSTGEASTEAARLNADQENAQSSPVVASGTDGDCWVAWQSDDGLGTGAVFGRYFAGCDLSSGGSSPDIQLSGPADNASVRTPAVSVSDDGTFTAFYAEDDTQEGDGGILGRALDVPQSTAPPRRPTGRRGR